MKTLKLLIFTLSIVFIGCEKFDNINDNNLISNELYSPNDYNLDLKYFSIAVSQALQSNNEFRNIIKEESLLMFDGDYDILLSKIIDREIKTNTLSDKNYNSKKYTVEDLLNKSYNQNEDFIKSKTSKGLSIIEELSIKYPHLQISIPIHANEWDQENYIPIVAFLPDNYDESSTKYIPGYDEYGNNVEVDAINEPEEPVIVIAQNERVELLDYSIIQEGLVPSTPFNLLGTQTESGIRLKWDMPSTADNMNTSGYYLYRKGVDDTSYLKIATIYGVYNRSFDDNNVEANRSYSYFVMSYNQGLTSGASNYITVTAPNYPKPVLSFEAIQQSKNQIELRWENDHSQYILETKLYKYVVGGTGGYQQIGTFTPNQHDYFDNNVLLGKKVLYKVTHRTSLGESNAKYDFVQAPYRDISKPSPVYIKKITIGDLSGIEGWPAGKPEFYVTVSNVGSLSKEPYTIQDQINLKFDTRSKESQTFTGKKVLDWRPGFWYDMLSFYALEYDRSWGTLKVNASVGYQKKNDNKDGFTANGSVDYEIEFSDKGEKCGNSYLYYYDNPEIELEFPNYGVKILVSENDN